MLFLLLAVAVLAGSGQDMETVDENPSPEYNYLNLDPSSFVDDPNAPEPDPQFTIRPNVPYTRRGNGTATVRFTGPVVIIVRPSLLARTVGISGARRATLPAGSEITGPDSNRNNIPDDLEAQEVDVSNGQ